VPHCCTSALKGEPVAPKARMLPKPGMLDKSKPAFMQLVKNAAPPPKKVIFSCAA
jgi:hypothetical protein